MCERDFERLVRMMSETARVVKCRYNLYSSCIVYENTNHLVVPKQSDCVLCIKVWRLKEGLKTVHEYRGFRTGATI